MTHKCIFLLLQNNVTHCVCLRKQTQSVTLDVIENSVLLHVVNPMCVEVYTYNTNNNKTHYFHIVTSGPVWLPGPLMSHWISLDYLYDLNIGC